MYQRDYSLNGMILQDDFEIFFHVWKQERSDEKIPADP